ncbi:cytochrome c [Aurantimonas sp. C2-6-R+9]|uniref:c-type cytochrome n=1 Tax=unclassified Aurantimonas TaxID=2638230 RepID=UPI002E16CADD|nr:MULTISPECIES: cytochrome c [unclassified Aurantimonas]MEC5291636.1 cytochrome c [Aurantimonas sp. C2-3-R2]MEC5381775.1 cytochrome c [Aurantimonas sp. C2-6-R+9]MEC5412720.1 cytochrome c [Aurantimonas sp. C2-4-R8]
MQIRTLALVLATTTAAAFALPAVAQNAEPIKQRQELMEGNGKAAKLSGQMLKGEAEFDPTKAAEAFQAFHQAAEKFGSLFPEDSKTGEETEAAPAIWEKPEEFQAAVAKFEKDAATAIAADPQDIDAFKQSFAMVAENCKGCHEDFRIKKEK